MKRNLIITIQSSFESDLSWAELDQKIVDIIKREIPKIEGATPTGDYMVSIRPGPLFRFPRPVEELEVDQTRSIEKEVKDDEKWNG